MFTTEGFQAGDMVRLKSGGKDMMVIGIREIPLRGIVMVRCVWQVAGKPYDQPYPSDALELVRRDNKG